MSIITLDLFLSSKPVPYTKFLKEKNFTTRDGKPFQGYTYKGRKCLTIETLLPHIEHMEKGNNPTYDTVRKAVLRSIKEYPMKIGIDYDKVTPEEFSCVKIRGKHDFIYVLYRTGTILTTASLSKSYRCKILYFLVHYYFDSEDKKANLQIYDGKYSLYELPTFPGKYMARDATQHGSKAEVDVYERALDYGIPIARMDFLSKYVLTPESRELIEKHLGRKYPGLDFDYQIITEPLTIVDVHGSSLQDPFYDLKCWVKEQVCNIEGFSLIIFNDTDTIPQIDFKWKKYFVPEEFSGRKISGRVKGGY